jgi:hypothetical protein
MKQAVRKQVLIYWRLQLDSHNFAHYLLHYRPANRANV